MHIFSWYGTKAFLTPTKQAYVSILSMEFPVFNKSGQRKIYIYDLVKAARIISSFCTVTLKTGNWLNWIHMPVSWILERPLTPYQENDCVQNWHQR